MGIRSGPISGAGAKSSEATHRSRACTAITSHTNAIAAHTVTAPERAGSAVVSRRGPVRRSVDPDVTTISSFSFKHPAPAGRNGHTLRCKTGSYPEIGRIVASARE